MFRLPDITYPLSIDTIGKVMATGHELSVNCNTQGCHHWGYINLVKLSYRLGIDHSCLAEDLRPHFYCPECRAAGRPDKNLTFIDHAQVLPHSKWPRVVKVIDPDAPLDRRGPG